MTYYSRPRYGPGVDSALNKNEYQEYFLGGKGGRCVRLTTLPPSCAAVMKSENRNFLEPSGPLQACNGTALLFFLTLYLRDFFFKSRLGSKLSCLRPSYGSAVVIDEASLFEPGSKTTTISSKTFSSTLFS